jgi:hypothetical protein
MVHFYDFQKLLMREFLMIAVPGCVKSVESAQDRPCSCEQQKWLGRGLT